MLNKGQVRSGQDKQRPAIVAVQTLYRESGKGPPWYPVTALFRPAPLRILELPHTRPLRLSTPATTEPGARRRDCRDATRPGEEGGDALHNQISPPARPRIRSDLTHVFTSPKQACERASERKAIRRSRETRNTKRDAKLSNAYTPRIERRKHSLLEIHKRRYRERERNVGLLHHHHHPYHPHPPQVATAAHHEILREDAAGPR